MRKKLLFIGILTIALIIPAVFFASSYFVNALSTIPPVSHCDISDPIIIMGESTIDSSSSITPFLTGIKEGVSVSYYKSNSKFAFRANAKCRIKSVDISVNVNTPIPSEQGNNAPISIVSLDTFQTSSNPNCVGNDYYQTFTSPIYLEQLSNAFSPSPLTSTLSVTARTCEGQTKTASYRISYDIQKHKSTIQKIA